MIRGMDVPCDARVRETLKLQLHTRLPATDAGTAVLVELH